MEINLCEWALGLSARRAAWISGWLEKTIAAGKVSIDELKQAVGRLQFAYGVIIWDKPFLAPLYTLANIHTPEDVVNLPPFVAAAMLWLKARILQRRKYFAGGVGCNKRDSSA